MKRRKKIRLDRSAYKEPNRFCSLTICLEKDRNYFQDRAFSGETLRILNDCAKCSKIELLAYCLMPDHVHLLVRTVEGSDIVLFVQKFKSLVSKAARSYFNEPRIWQRRFYDRFLREEESVNQVIEYILNNPVRKGLVSNWNEYSLSGTAFEI